MALIVPTGWGIRLAQFVVDRLRRRDEDVELIDAKAVNLPMLDRMYKEYPKGHAPEALEQLARKIRGRDRELFGRTFVRCAGGNRLARDTL
jgi:hypothetical protein